MFHNIVDGIHTVFKGQINFLNVFWPFTFRRQKCKVKQVISISYEEHSGVPTVSSVTVNIIDMPCTFALSFIIRNTEISYVVP